jgi:ElaB/YqjD/DUF883 family membrane-anchored ribosome-binding protein
MENSTASYTNGQAQASLANMGHSLEQITDKVVETTADLSHTAMETIKKYPLHTALAAGVVGFLVGTLISRKK